MLRECPYCKRCGKKLSITIDRDLKKKVKKEIKLNQPKTEQ